MFVVEHYQNCMQIQKSTFKNKKPKTPYLIAIGGHNLLK